MGNNLYFFPDRIERADTSGCSGYGLFDRGICIEEFNWGCDYTEEAWGIAPEELLQFVEEREAQGKPLPPAWDPRQWNVYCFDGIGSYQFRSSLRTATETEVLNTNNFLNTLLCAQDAWLPDWDYLPWEHMLSSLRHVNFMQVAEIAHI